MSTLYKDNLFAPLDADLHLVRVAGGNETEVYASDDQRYVIKVKSCDAGTLTAGLARAVLRQRAAAAFAAAIGDSHSIPSYVLIARNSAGEVQPLVVQPYHREAMSLAHLNYGQLTHAERVQIARQLVGIIGRNVLTYLRRGWMPDIYGRVSGNAVERTHANRWRRLPERLWSFLVKRSLLRSHNLLVTAAPERRIILVDYDPVPHGRLYRFVYYKMRLLLFVRDLVLIFLMAQVAYRFNRKTAQTKSKVH
jgi:hypothetical protein